jgi:urate oxidase
MSMMQFFISSFRFQTDPDQVMVIATKEIDNCTIEKIEFQDKSVIKGFLKDLSSEHIGQKLKFRFHIIYFSDGKLLKQTLNYEGKSDLCYPVEIKLQ